MNFILCDECCAYQKDGECTLENVTTLDVTGDSRCCFFVGREGDTSDGKKGVPVIE